MMKKAGIIGWPSWLIGQPGPMKKLKTMQGFQQKVQTGLLDSAASGNAPADDIRRVADEAETYGADDREIGINASASPVPGQAYKIITALGDGRAYHWGAVVAASATDTLTLENYHKASELRALQLEFAKEQQALRAKGLAQHTLDQRMQALETRQN